MITIQFSRSSAVLVFAAAIASRALDGFATHYNLSIPKTGGAIAGETGAIDFPSAPAFIAFSAAVRKAIPAFSVTQALVTFPG